jgi:hypothetical protein
MNLRWGAFAWTISKFRDEVLKYIDTKRTTPDGMRSFLREWVADDTKNVHFAGADEEHATLDALMHERSSYASVHLAAHHADDHEASGREDITDSSDDVHERLRYEAHCNNRAHNMDVLRRYEAQHDNQLDRHTRFNPSSYSPAQNDSEYKRRWPPDPRNSEYEPRKPRDSRQLQPVRPSSAPRGCFNCGDVSHRWRECPQPPRLKPKTGAGAARPHF